MTCDVILFRQKRPDAAELENTLASIHDGELVNRHQGFAELLVIETLGEAELLFEDALSFVLTSEQYGNRLGLFASNQRAIVAPYIYEEIRIRLQSAALNYIALNQPNYTTAEAALLEDVLNSVVGEYVENGTIESGSVEVSTSAEQFILNAEIRVAEPKALWRIKADMYQGSV